MKTGILLVVCVLMLTGCSFLDMLNPTPQLKGDARIDTVESTEVAYGTTIKIHYTIQNIGNITIDKFRIKFSIQTYDSSISSMTPLMDIPIAPGKTYSGVHSLTVGEDSIKAVRIAFVYIESVAYEMSMIFTPTD